MKKIKKIFVSILFGKKESPALQGNACGARVIRIDREAPRRSEQAEKPLRAAAVAAVRGAFPEEFALRAAAGAAPCLCKMQMRFPTRSTR